MDGKNQIIKKIFQEKKELAFFGSKNVAKIRK